MQNPDFYTDLARISTTHAAELAARHDWQITPVHIAGFWQALLDHPDLPELWENSPFSFYALVQETTETWLSAEGFQIW